MLVFNALPKCSGHEFSDTNGRQWFARRLRHRPPQTGMIIQVVPEFCLVSPRELFGVAEIRIFEFAVAQNGELAREQE
jgi:hypothetical protein